MRRGQRLPLCWTQPNPSVSSEATTGQSWALSQDGGTAGKRCLRKGGEHHNRQRKRKEKFWETTEGTPTLEKEDEEEALLERAGIPCVLWKSCTEAGLSWYLLSYLFVRKYQRELAWSILILTYVEWTGFKSVRENGNFVGSERSVLLNMSSEKWQFPVLTATKIMGWNGSSCCIIQSLPVLCEAPGNKIPSENSRHSETMSTQQVLIVQDDLVIQQEMSHARNEQRRDSTISIYKENIFWKMLSLLFCNNYVFLLLTFSISI